MMRRRTQTTSLALLAIGTVGGTVGMITVFRSIRIAQHTAECQLSAAHTAGYRLALEHVARGLLDPPDAP